MLRSAITKCTNVSPEILYPRLQALTIKSFTLTSFRTQCSHADYICPIKKCSKKLRFLLIIDYGRNNSAKERIHCAREKYNTNHNVGIIKIIERQHSCRSVHWKYHSVSKQKQHTQKLAIKKEIEWERNPDRSLQKLNNIHSHNCTRTYISNETKEKGTSNISTKANWENHPSKKEAYFG